MVERSQRNPETAVVPEGVPGIGDVIDGKYRVEGVLGAGGMGIVLSARHVALGQFVAIKVLIIRDDQAQREAKLRLLREARAAAALTSDHVVRIYDMGEDDLGRPFIVMERLFGVDLGNLLAAQGPLPIPHAVRLVIQGSRAVAEAHSIGIVHRDLKPSNLFLTRRSDGGAHLKVLDFGIAKSLEARDLGQETLTGARVTLGSPSYMSPEQVRDARQVDGRSDIWSLGAILFELVTGKLAFHGNTLPGVCAAIVADSPPVPSTLRDGVPPELDRIILRCLEKDKTRRFPSVEALMAALEPLSAPAVDFGEMVPFSYLPETVGIHDAPQDSEGLPATAPAPPVEIPAVESPRFFPESHDRTLESGKALELPSSRARPRGGAVHRPTPIQLLVGFAVAAALAVLAWLWMRAPSAPETAESSVHPTPSAGASGPETAGFQPSSAALTLPNDAPALPSTTAEPQPTDSLPVRTPARQRPAPSRPSATPASAAPEIRMTR